MTLTNLSQITTSGIATLTDINLNNLTGVAATFTGNVTIGGTLTYEDVTNIDSVGLITARNGVQVKTGTATTALVVEGDARITGILSVGQGTITLDSSQNMLKLGATTMHQDNSTGDTILMRSGAYNPFRASKFLIDAVEVIDNDRVGRFAKVGIGTTNPTGKVQIDTTSGGRALTLNAPTLGTYVTFETADTAFADIGSEAGLTGSGSNTEMLTLNARQARAISFRTNSTERLRINSVGDVGIGTIAPHSNAGINLHIHGDNASSELRLTNTTTGGGGNGGILQQSGNTLYLSNTENGNIVFETNGSEKVRITSSGLVGIGDNNPNTKLTVKAGNGDQLRLDNAGERYTQISIRNNGTQKAALWLDETDDMFDVYTSSGYGIRFKAGGAESARIKSDGKVGIGTYNPSELLHLQSGWTKQILKSTNTNTASSLIFDTHNINTADFLLGQLAGRWNGNDVAYINFEAGADTTNKDDGVITFLTSSASSTPVERMRISNAGKVGINKNNPSSYLHVAAGDYQTLRLENTDNGANGPYIELYNNSDSPADDDYIGIISFKNNNSADEEITYAQIRSQSTDITDGTEDGVLTFHTRLNGTFGEKLRIDSTGRLLLGTTVEGASTGDQFTISGSGHAGMTIRSASSGEGNIFFSDGTSGDAEYRGIFRYDHNTDAMVFKTATAERLRITSGGSVNIGGEYTQTAARLYVQNGGECQLKISGNAAAGGTGALLVLKNRNSNNSTGSAIQGEDASGQTTCSIQFINHSDASNEGSLKFFTRPGNGNLTEHMYIDSNGPAYFKNSTGSLYLSSTTGNDGGRIVFRENNTEAWSIDSTRANAQLVIKDEYNNKERFRIDASGKISWNESASNMNSGDTMMLQSIASGSTKSTLAIRGGDSGYVHSALRLVSTSSHNSGNGRGTGTFYYDEVSDVEWFAGRPYSSSDYFIVARNTAVNGTQSGGVTAQHGKAMWYVDNTGATRQKKEQCIYRNESNAKSSRVNTVQGKNGTFSTITVDFNQASYGCVAYDIKVGGYSSAHYHRAGTYYCNSGLYANYTSINNWNGISHSMAYTSSQTVRHTFSYTNGFVHPVVEVTASCGGDGYFVEGSITISIS